MAFVSQFIIARAPRRTGPTDWLARVAKAASRRYADVMDVVNRNAAVPFITKDGSEIRELLAHRNSCIRRQSLAEATLPPGGSTQEHYHATSEEIYYILSGHGLMRVADEQREVGPLDAIALPPRVRHKLTNTGCTPLVFLCCCAPPYEHEDTMMQAPA
jgi:mannose-6-phosphate isomerase-like protein (cupin superfamily)